MSKKERARNKKIKRKRRIRRNELTFKILLEFFVSVAISALVLILICIFSVNALFDGEVVVAICVAIMIILIFIFVYRAISKALRYLDEIMDNVGELVNPTPNLIELSVDLSSVQEELNHARETSLFNSIAAKEAEKRKNDLIVYLAHDLKTPLTSVIGYLTLLNDEPEIPAQLKAKYTNISLNKALRLEDLINEFFDITRFNLTQLTLEKESINLTRMLEQLTYEFCPVMMEKGLSWNLSIEQNVHFYCDPDKFQRVFDNLIRNAINYSYPNTEICFSMKTDINNLIIVVQNKGKTISEEKLSKIFEQFFRLDSSRATATGGAGLGLAIAKEIVELHDGKIYAKSQNETIAFIVKLPLMKYDYM